MNITIKVTEKHIAKGQRTGPRSCPIALAFRDAGYDVGVASELHWGRHFTAPLTKPTKSMRAFVNAFDAKLKVKPQKEKTMGNLVKKLPPQAINTTQKLMQDTGADLIVVGLFAIEDGGKLLTRKVYSATQAQQLQELSACLEMVVDEKLDHLPEVLPDLLAMLRGPKNKA